MAHNYIFLYRVRKQPRVIFTVVKRDLDEPGILSRLMKGATTFESILDNMEIKFIAGKSNSESGN